MKVYVVTTGDFDDTSVAAIYAKEEDAQRYIKEQEDRIRGYAAACKMYDDFRELHLDMDHEQAEEAFSTIHPELAWVHQAMMPEYEFWHCKEHEVQ